MLAVDEGLAGIALGVGYLLGSIPFGLIFSFVFGSGDVRKIGSGNIGATNVLRTGRRELAAATLVLDVIDALDTDLDEDIATCIYAGLVTDTGSFKWARPDSFRVAARLP